MALPCYADEARDIDTVIDDELRKAGMSMTLEARQALRRNLGGDRLASRGEIEKLMLYAHGQQAKSALDDVKAMSGDVSGASFDDAVDAVLEGKVDDFDSRLHPPLPVRRPALSWCCHRPCGNCRRSRPCAAQMEAGGRNAASVVAAARPPVFFTRRKLVEKTLERWSSEALSRALVRLQTAVLQTRRRPGSLGRPGATGAAWHRGRKRAAATAAA